ncbi:hypothetical protein LCGC14_2946940, partial [marine sediment metagenome]
MVRKAAGVPDSKIGEIRNFSTKIEAYNTNRINEQRVDRNYYEDNFEVGITDPFHVVRTGTSARVVDSIIDHLELSNPQVFQKPRKNTEAARKSSAKIAKFLNKLIQQFMPEITEFTRNLVLYGEAVGQVQYNNQYSDGLDDSVPLMFTAPDPMNMFCWPYDVLVPQKVVKKFMMKEMALHGMIPEWKGEVLAGEVDYLAYWDKDTRYIEAGKTALSKGNNGVEVNYLKFVSFVHCYSGFGKKSA